MQRGIFVFSIILLIYVAAKVYLLQGDIFDFSWQKGLIGKGTTTIYVNFAVGVWLFWFSLKDLIKYNKTGVIEHGADERNKKILYLSTMNACMLIVFILYGMALYGALFNGLNDKVFSVADISKAFFPGIVVFFYCAYWHYEKKKNL